MNQSLVRQLGVVLVAWLGVALLVNAPGGGTAPLPPAPSQSPSPTPTPTCHPCDDDLVSIDDFVMWDSVQGGFAEVPVYARKPCPEPRIIYYDTFDGTAHAGEDYVGVQSGSFVIPAGATRTTVKIKILGDNLNEQNEYFGVRLLAGAKFADPIGIVTLRDH